MYYEKIEQNDKASVGRANRELRSEATSAGKQLISGSKWPSCV